MQPRGLPGDQFMDLTQALGLHVSNQDPVQLQKNLDLYINLKLASYGQATVLQKNLLSLWWQQMICCAVLWKKTDSLIRIFILHTKGYKIL